MGKNPLNCVKKKQYLLNWLKTLSIVFFKKTYLLNWAQVTPFSVWARSVSRSLTWKCSNLKMWYFPFKHDVCDLIWFWFEMSFCKYRQLKIPQLQGDLSYFNLEEGMSSKMNIRRQSYSSFSSSKWWSSYHRPVSCAPPASTPLFASTSSPRVAPSGEDVLVKFVAISSSSPSHYPLWRAHLSRARIDPAGSALPPKARNPLQAFSHLGHFHQGGKSKSQERVEDIPAPSSLGLAPQLGPEWSSWDLHFQLRAVLRAAPGFEFRRVASPQNWPPQQLSSPSLRPRDWLMISIAESVVQTSNIVKDETSATNLSSSLPVWVQCWSIRWEVTCDKVSKKSPAKKIILIQKSPGTKFHFH